MSENAPVEISPDLIDPHPRNARIGVPHAIVDALAAQFLATGFHRSLAIVVRRKQNGRLEAVSGHLRLLAAKKAKLSLIWVLIETMTDHQALLRLSTDNVHEALTPLEHALAYLEFHDEGVPVTQADYAAQVGYHPPNFSRYVKAAWVFRKARPAIADDNVITSCRHLAEQLYEIAAAEEDDWPTLVTRCVAEGWTKKSAAAHVALFLKGANARSGDAESDEADPAEDAEGEQGSGDEFDDDGRDDRQEEYEDEENQDDGEQDEVGEDQQNEESQDHEEEQEEDEENEPEAVSQDISELGRLCLAFAEVCARWSTLSPQFVAAQLLALTAADENTAAERADRLAAILRQATELASSRSRVEAAYARARTTGTRRALGRLQAETTRLLDGAHAFSGTAGTRLLERVAKL